MVDLIDRIADVALARGVTPVIHQHAGCFIEFEDELDELLHALDPAKVGICIDTGHMAYAGIDPVKYYEAQKSRVMYFHFKDIDRTVHARALEQSIPFLEAVRQNVFCPIGKGVVDWAALASALEASGYDGSANVEQDIDPAVSLAPLEDAKASRSYLRSVGF
jgi:inosose dehydratase